MIDSRIEAINKEIEAEMDRHQRAVRTLRQQITNLNDMHTNKMQALRKRKENLK